MVERREVEAPLHPRHVVGAPPVRRGVPLEGGAAARPAANGIHEVVLDRVRPSRLDPGRRVGWVGEDERAAGGALAPLEALELEDHVPALRQRVEGEAHAVAGLAQHRAGLCAFAARAKQLGAAAQLRLVGRGEARPGADQHGEFLLAEGVGDRHRGEARLRALRRHSQHAVPERGSHPLAPGRGHGGGARHAELRRPRRVHQHQLALRPAQEARGERSLHRDLAGGLAPGHDNPGRRRGVGAEAQAVLARRQPAGEHPAVHHHLRHRVEARHSRDRRAHPHEIGVARANLVAQQPRRQRTERLAAVAGDLQLGLAAGRQPGGVARGDDRKRALHRVAERIRLHAREGGVGRLGTARVHEKAVREVREEAVHAVDLALARGVHLVGVVLQPRRIGMRREVRPEARRRAVLEVVLLAVVREPHAEALARAQPHPHLLLVAGVLHHGPPERAPHEMVGRLADAVVHPRLVLGLPQRRGRLVVHRREEALAREVVDVVLAVVEHLLEAVPVACGLPRRAVHRAGEEVGREVVQRAALEPAVGVEHHKRVAQHLARGVSAARERDLVAHEVVACADHELEQAVGALAVRQPAQGQRVCGVREAAHVEVAVVEQRRIVESALVEVGYLHVVGHGALGHGDRHLAAVRQALGAAAGHAGGGEVGGVGHVGIVVDVERLAGIRRRQYGGGEVLRLAAVDRQRVRHAARQRARGAGHEARAAARHAVERAVEGEESARGVVAGEFPRGREAGRVARAGGDAQQIRRALEERVRGRHVRARPRPSVVAAEEELHVRLVVRVPGALEVAHRVARQLEGERAPAAHEHLGPAAGRELRRHVRPLAGGEVCRARAVEAAPLEVLQREGQEPAGWLVGKLQHGTLAGLPLVRHVVLLGVEEAADAVPGLLHEGRPVGLEPRLHRAGAVGVEEQRLVAQVPGLGPRGLRVRLVVEGVPGLAAQGQRRVAGTAGDAGGEQAVLELRERQRGRRTKRQVGEQQLRARLVGVRARQAVGVHRILHAAQLKLHAHLARLRVQPPLLAVGAPAAPWAHVRDPARVHHALGQLFAGGVELAQRAASAPGHWRERLEVELELHALAGQRGGHLRLAVDHAGAVADGLEQHAARLRRGFGASGESPARRIRPAREEIVAARGVAVREGSHARLQGQRRGARRNAEAQRQIARQPPLEGDYGQGLLAFGGGCPHHEAGAGLHAAQALQLGGVQLQLVRRRRGVGGVPLQRHHRRQHRAYEVYWRHSPLLLSFFPASVFGVSAARRSRTRRWPPRRRTARGCAARPGGSSPRAGRS